VPQETLLDPILFPTLKNPAGSNVQRTSNSSIVRQGCLSSPTLFAKSIFTVKIERDIDEREKRVNLGPFHVRKSPGTHPGVARPPHRKHNPQKRLSSLDLIYLRVAHHKVFLHPFANNKFRVRRGAALPHLVCTLLGQ
jgi:hypothetical protein